MHVTIKHINMAECGIISWDYWGGNEEDLSRGVKQFSEFFLLLLLVLVGADVLDITGPSPDEV